MEKLVEAFLANLPLMLSVIAALGAWQAGAAAIRKFVAGWKKDAAKTPSKIDDAVASVVGGALEVLAEAIEHGDKQGALKQIGVIKDGIKKK